MASSPLLLLGLLLGLMVFPSVTLAEVYRNVSLNSSLSPIGPTTSWLSPSGDFAFGFLPFQGNFLLGIWFDKTPNKTVVWTAKTSSPLQARSTLELKVDGRLVLSDSNGNEVWTVDNNSASVTHAAMLDSGNFVVVSASDGLLWQSFDYPTDTILPTQTLGLGKNLVAHLMDNDNSDGKFKLAIKDDGDLVLYVTNGPNSYAYGPYWSSSTVGNGTSLMFVNSGKVFMALRGDGSLNVLTCSECKAGIYQRATLDYDGVFRYYYMKMGDTGWSVAALIPANICTAIRIDMGDGACGFNAYCTSDGKGNPSCQCPTRYSFIDPIRKYKGCKPDFPQPVCGENGSSGNGIQYELSPMINVDWPLSDYETYMNEDEQSCGKKCLDDCLCAVAIIRASQCWKKRLPLSNGRADGTWGGKALLKTSIRNSIVKNETEPPYPNFEDKAGKSSWRLSTLATSFLLGGSSFFSLLLFCLCTFLYCYYFRHPQKPLQTSDWSMLESGMQSFSFKELEESTQHFRHELGRGASGVVYKGTLSAENAKIDIAVKRLANLNGEDEKEFTNEVKAIGQTRHKNLVKLLGFCNEGTHRLLVYEYITNGSLPSFLFGSLRLDWNQRIHIAHGIARGLVYLHEECENQIIHCDIKPQNVLLDGLLVAKISDFGLAKLLKTDQTRTLTGIRGTRGYVAPEWFRGAPITSKVDVYSFGVMLLEIICCRRNVAPEFEDSNEAILTDWAYDCYRLGRLHVLAGDGKEEIGKGLILERLITVALWCIQEDPALRPSMKSVVLMLEGSADVHVPPDPSGDYST